MALGIIYTLTLYVKALEMRKAKSPALRCLLEHVAAWAGPVARLLGTQFGRRGRLQAAS